MEANTAALWFLFIAAAIGLLIHAWYAVRGSLSNSEGFTSSDRKRGSLRNSEGFVSLGAGTAPGPSLMDMSTAALDAAPSTSEAKKYYKQLLLFADQDIKKQGTAGLRLLADFRDRVYGPRNFRANLTVDDFLGSWPDWLPALDTTIDEPPVTPDDAVMSEVRVLAYLQKNYPQEDMVDEQTGSLIRGIVEDFGYRFVFIKGQETVALADDFLRQPLLKNWTNPIARA